MNCINHPDRDNVAFCQNCGKPLCKECVRSVGSAVFCEPCLAERLAAAEAGAGYPPPSPRTPGPASVPPASGVPNPGLAGLLGLIPGVGAMYNGQYAKGIVHLIIFAVLVSLSDKNGLFGLFVFGWVIYQCIEAHHTARARRDGTPLPNPFGLNDIGERLGFGRAWPSTPPAGTYPPPPAGTAQYAADTAGNVSYTGGDSSRFTQSPYGQAYTAPPAGSAADASYSSFVPPAASASPYEPPYVPVPPVPPTPPLEQTSRFPVGAVWLIALGLIFFIGSSGIFHGLRIDRLFPFVLIGFGVWIFVHRMTGAGQSLSDDGTPGYRLRVMRALRGAVWIILVGVLFLLDTFDILSWGHSWPLFIIVAGVMGFLERSMYNAAAPANPYGYPAQGYVPPTPPPVSSAPGATASPVSSDEERR